MHIRLLETMNGTSFTVLQTETTPYRFNSFLVAKYSATSSAVPQQNQKRRSEEWSRNVAFRTLKQAPGLRGG